MPQEPAVVGERMMVPTRLLRTEWPRSDGLRPGDARFDDVFESVKREGIREPLTIHLNWSVIDGAHRLYSALDLGLEWVPVRVWTGLEFLPRAQPDEPSAVVVLREAVEEMFRAEEVICVSCGLVMFEDADMLTSHEYGDEEARACLTLPLRRVLRDTAAAYTEARQQIEREAVEPWRQVLLTLQERVLPEDGGPCWCDYYERQHTWYCNDARKLLASAEGEKP